MPRGKKKRPVEEKRPIEHPGMRPGSLLLAFGAVVAPIALAVGLRLVNVSSCCFLLVVSAGVQGRRADENEGECRGRASGLHKRSACKNRVRHDSGQATDSFEALGAFR